MSITEAREPRCEACDEDDGVTFVVEGRPRLIGDLEVTRVLPARELRAVGPFVFLDHMGPVVFAPGAGVDVKPHPHIGLSTVTYLFEGEVVHRDSTGCAQATQPGDVNLMTAGRGVVHSERSTPARRAHGSALHGIQLWLGLPTANEDDPPSFEHHPRTSLPEIRGAGMRGRVLLGTAFRAASPIRHPSRPFLAEVALHTGVRFEAGGAGIEHRAVYVVEGEVQAGGRAYPARRLLVSGGNAELRVEATRPSRIVVLGGPALEGERFIDWNFVSSSRARIDEAKAAWRAQTFPRIPGDDQEHVPLPG